MHNTTVVGGTGSVLDAAKVMSGKNIGSVLVRGEQGLGMLTERDILKKVVACNRIPGDVGVSEVMTSLNHTIDVDSDVVDASRVFGEHHVRRLPVTEKNAIVGIITTRDVAMSVGINKLKQRRVYQREYRYYPSR